MTERDREALTAVVAELTEGGARMDRLPHTQEEVVWRLREEQGRPEDADRIAEIPPFRLNGTDDGLVRVWTGAGFAHGENLTDFGGDGETATRV